MRPEESLRWKRFHVKVYLYRCITQSSTCHPQVQFRKWNIHPLQQSAKPLQTVDKSLRAIAFPNFSTSTVSGDHNPPLRSAFHAKLHRDRYSVPVL